MYCKNCQLEIKDQEGTECPLCGSTLVEPSVKESRHDTAVGIDFDAMQDDAAAFVLDNEESGDMELESQPERGMQMQDTSDHASPSRPQGLIDDATTEMLDQALEEYDPMVDEHFKVKKTGSKSRTILLLIVLVVCVLGLGGYFFKDYLMKEPVPPEPATPVKIATPKKQDAVLDKVLRKEPAAPATAQMAAVDNATQAPPKHEPLKAAQTADKKTEVPAVVEQPVAEPKPVVPVEPAKAPEKTVQSDKKQPAVIIDKTDAPAPASHKAEAPAPVIAPEPARETVKAVAEPAKKPAAPAAAAPEKPAARNGQPVFSVLIGSFKNQSNAEAEASRLSKFGYDVRAVDVDLKAKGLWHRVLIGSYKSRSEALKMAEEIRRKTGKKDASVIAAE